MTPNPAPCPAIDLNCDLGESPDPAQIASDLALLRIVTSANIACGGHAGDEASMARTIRAAIERGVAIGAHPSYPDRARFGRIELDISPESIEAAVTDQIAALTRAAGALGAAVSHVKPHGALYHAAMTRGPVAEAIARAAHRLAPKAVLVGLAGAPALERWREMGFAVAAEAFADRRYEPDGSLRSRSKPGALLDDPAEATEQAIRIALRRCVETSGGPLRVEAQTICVHGDTPGAPALAAAVRLALERSGIAVRRFAT